MSQDDLNNLYTKREQIKDLIRWSKIYGGKISLNDEVITADELKILLMEVNAEIATIISNSKLKLGGHYGQHSFKNKSQID